MVVGFGRAHVGGGSSKAEQRLVRHFSKPSPKLLHFNLVAPELIHGSPFPGPIVSIDLRHEFQPKSGTGIGTASDYRSFALPLLQQEQTRARRQIFPTKRNPGL